MMDDVAAYDQPNIGLLFAIKQPPHTGATHVTGVSGGTSTTEDNAENAKSFWSFSSANAY